MRLMDTPTSLPPSPARASRRLLGSVLRLLLPGVAGLAGALLAVWMLYRPNLATLDPWRDWPETVVVAGILGGTAAAWAGSLSGRDGTRSRFLAVIGMDALAAAVLAGSSLLFLASPVRSMLRLSELLALCVALIALVSGVVVARFRTGSRSLTERLVTSVASAGIAIGAAFAVLEGTPYAPTALLPYKQVGVHFTSGGVQLAGVLLVPPSHRLHPGVVVVHGSGRDTRNQFRWLGDHLARRGIEVLLYDKRGVGGSGGKYPKRPTVAAFHTLAKDALAGVRLLESRPEVNRDRVGLWGFSQGARVVPYAAAHSRNVAFVVCVSGATVTVGEIELYERLTGDATHSSSHVPPAVIRREMARAKPWGFDPFPSIRRLRVPGLWIYGAADRHIPVHRSVVKLERLQHGGKDVTIELFRHANHDLEIRPSAGQWGFPKRAPGFVKALTNWILLHVQTSP